MKTYRGEGKRIRWTNGTGGDVSSGDVVVIGGVAGVAVTDIADGSTGMVEVTGDHALTATTAEAWPIGTLLYADVSASNALTADPDSGDVPLGFASVAKAASATAARAVLTPPAAAAAASANALDWQDSVIDTLDFTSDEPTGQSAGDRYLNTGAGSSSETSQTVAAGEIVQWSGTDWTRITPSEGMAVMDEDGSQIKIFTTSWVDIGTPANLETLTDGSDADSLHVHTLGNLTGVGTAAFDAGKLLVADGTDLESVALSGDGSLAADGTLSINSFAAMPTIPAAEVAATGSNQGDAAAVATGFTHVTGADATKGVKLPAAAAGKVCIIKNADAANAVLPVYPNTDDAINALSANSSLDMAAKTSCMLVALDDTTWYSVPLLPS